MNSNTPRTDAAARTKAVGNPMAAMVPVDFARQLAASQAEVARLTKERDEWADRHRMQRTEVADLRATVAELAKDMARLVENGSVGIARGPADNKWIMWKECLREARRIIDAAKAPVR